MTIIPDQIEFLIQIEEYTHANKKIPIERILGDDKTLRRKLEDIFSVTKDNHAARIKKMDDEFKKRATIAKMEGFRTDYRDENKRKYKKAEKQLDKAEIGRDKKCNSR